MSDLSIRDTASVSRAGLVRRGRLGGRGRADHVIGRVRSGPGPGSGGRGAQQGAGLGGPMEGREALAHRRGVDA